MHADREGANNLLRTAAASLVEAFQIARSTRAGKGAVPHAGLMEFFKQAFDRNADPCLEGRVGRIMEYLDSKKQSKAAADCPPWADVSLEALPASTSSRDVVGEHLRVFINECTWRWSKD